MKKDIGKTKKETMMPTEKEHHILVVDDETAITKALYRVFRKDGFKVHTAQSGSEGLEILRNTDAPVSLIISDQRMPNMTGAQFLEQAKEIMPAAIRFLLTGFSDMNAVVDAVNQGQIHRYLTKPWNNDDLLLQAHQAIKQVELVEENKRLHELTQTQNRQLYDISRSLDKKVKERTHALKEKNIALDAANRKLESSFMHTVRFVLSMVDTGNPLMAKYMRHVARLARQLAKALKLSPSEVYNIEIAGLLHDIGILGLPFSMMQKPEKSLTNEEFKLFGQHPIFASITLESVEKLSEISDIVLYHHEHYDGNGFPNGLGGNEIPLGAQIIGAVSAYCQIVDLWPKELNTISVNAKILLGATPNQNIQATSPNEMLEEVAERMLLAGAHRAFDPRIVTLLMGCLKTRERKDEWDNFRKHPLSDLKPGMRLVEDLFLYDGRLLLTKGITLTTASIRSLQKIGEKQLIPNSLSVSD